MTFSRSEIHLNGDMPYRFYFFECDRCKHEIPENHPHYHDNKKPFHLCWDCSFKEGLVDERKFLNIHGFGLSTFHAMVYNGGIKIYYGRSPLKKHVRPAYATSKWRQKVFARDNFTCQICNKRGGELNAHHIKPYAKFKDLRFKVSNGLTLCVECHMELHRKKRK